MMIVPLHIYHIRHYIPISTDINLWSFKLRSRLLRRRGQLHAYIHILEDYMTIVVEFSYMHLQNPESKSPLAPFPVKED
jgi:hypothetical protein